MITGILRIIRKDVLRTRLLIGLLLLELSASTVISGHAGEGAVGSFLLTLLIFFTIIVFAASLVLEDSPSQPDAFWRATPVRPVVVLSAKFLGTTLIVLPLLLLAQTTALSMNGISIEQSSVFSLHSLALILGLFPTIMLIAAVSQNFKSFLIGIILLFMLSSTLSNVTYIANWGAAVSEVPWLNAIEYVQLLSVVMALFLVYVRDWTIDQSRVVTILVLAIVPLLQLGLQAGVLSLIYRSDVENSLPSTNYSATIKGDAILVQFAIKAPPSNIVMALANLSPRIQLTDGWYRLGTMSKAPGFEDKVGEAFRSGQISTTGLQLGENYDRSVIVDGDSLRIGLSFRFEPYVRAQISQSNSPVKLSGTLVMSQPRVMLNVPADTQYHNGTMPGIDISVIAVPDSGLWLRVRGRSLGPLGNSVGETFLGEMDSARGKLLRSYGYFSSTLNDTAMLVAQESSDTVRFLWYGSGARSDATLLPVPFAVVQDAKVNLKPDSASENIDLREFVKHARFEYHGLRYFNHIRLDASVPLTRP